MSGGGAGGGGTAEIPQYVKEIHSNWLSITNGPGKDGILKSITACMSDAMSGPSPYSGFQGLDVDTLFFGPSKGITDFRSPFSYLDDLASFDVEAKYDEYYSLEMAKVDTVMTAEGALLQDEILSKQLPEFQAAMDSINAVQSSSFVIGEALMWSGKTKSMAKNDAMLRLDRLEKAAATSIQRISAYIEARRLVVTFSFEAARIYAATRHDMDVLLLEIKAKDRLFDCTIFQYGGNVLAAVQGGTVTPPAGMSPFASGLSGAMSGAAAGAMIAGPWGAAAGGVLGLAGGLMSAK